MSNISAIVPVEQMDAANAALEEQGCGPGNFSVPLGTGERSSHAGLHAWADPVFRTKLEALRPEFDVEITEAEGVRFAEAVQARALAWQKWDGDQAALPKIGDERLFDGKRWVSLTDYNHWKPPVGWREVVAEGYPAWVQPTGAHDAYPLKARVTHKGKVWENTGSAANVWEPGVFGWVEVK